MFNGLSSVGNGLRPVPKHQVWCDNVTGGISWSAVRAYSPTKFVGKVCSAIASTAASSVVSVIEMTRDGTLLSKGFLKQEHIAFEAFLSTHSGAAYKAGQV